MSAPQNMGRSIWALPEVTDDLDHGVVLLDGQERIRGWNEWMRKRTPAASKVLGRRLTDVMPEVSERLVRAVRLALESSRASVLSSVLGPPPLPLALKGHRVTVYPLRLGGRISCLLRVRDLSSAIERDAQMHAQQQTIEAQSQAIEESRRALLEASHLDLTTGLINRGLFVRRLDQLVQGACPAVAVIVVDIDRLKSINDALGRIAGDLLLAQLARRFASSIQGLGTLARLGGDEFGVLLDRAARPADAILTAERLLEAIAKPLQLGAEEVYITGAAGVALATGNTQGAAALLERAERALLRAKEDGPGRCRLFCAQLDQQPRRSVKLQSELHRALDQQRFRLAYQPQVRLHDSEVIGVEALLRLELPGRGPISPARFVPLLEASGLIHRVGAWVLQEAAEQCRAISAMRGRPTRMSVNASPEQLRDPNFLEAVQAALDGSGLAPELLEIELTEGMLMTDVESSLRALAALKSLGVRVAVDDFGTGYSSLSYLKRFPVDTLKIDRAFITDLTEDAKDQAICAAIIHLGRRMGMEVIAEGVETEAQLELLRADGCHLVQGYLTGRPMELPALKRWFTGSESVAGA